MSGVETRTVAADEAEVRLDRWFRRHFPELGHGRLQKLLRTGQVRIDGRRAQANARLRPGQTIRVPPLPAGEPAAPVRTASGPGDPADARWLRSRLLFEDHVLLVLDKPAGLAVQGGTRTRRHLDGMLQALAAGGERPRLVHRLDRDTSGLLVVARTAGVAAKLTAAFRRHEVDKLYWALAVGRPPAAQGRIDRPLAKQPGRGGERVAARENGVAAETAYRVVARAGKVAAWLALKPLTGRTHQLRAHCALLGTPIVGDGKYGGAAAHPTGAPKGLMLHARELRLPHPDGGTLELRAPLSEPVLAGFRWLGFEPDQSLPGARLADFDPA
jgi:23S rRNA pseudouridine955/2504/2580 synthase